ncbi:MAG: DUF5519 family protein [Verrucomicrobiaceae bacterium]|nr:DUF5519 family protein [Verrucomicrobiaceae bacterium]
MIFAFAVRRLKWLAAIPGAPQIFDAMLVGSTALFYPARLRAISAIEKAATEMPGVRPGVHRLGGIGFFFRGRECSHIHGNGLLDCLVGRTNRDALLRDGRAFAHHVLPRSGWISFWIRDGDDVPRAVDLIRISCAYQQGAK